MTGMHTCHCVCIFMYKQMYTYICIPYNIWKWIGNNHIIYNTYLSSSNFRGHCERRDFYRALVRRFTFSLWFGIKPLTLSQGCCRTLNKPRHRTQPHRLFGLFAAGQHKHPTYRGWGTARKKQTHTDTSSNSHCTHLVGWMGRPKIQGYKQQQKRMQQTTN